jgi:hypothetical protein
MHYEVVHLQSFILVFKVFMSFILVFKVLRMAPQTPHRGGCLTLAIWLRAYTKRLTVKNGRRKNSVDFSSSPLLARWLGSRAADHDASLKKIRGIFFISPLGKSSKSK